MLIKQKEILVIQWLGLGALTTVGTCSISSQGTKIPQTVWAWREKKIHLLSSYAQFHNMCQVILRLLLRRSMTFSFDLENISILSQRDLGGLMRWFSVSSLLRTGFE